jgi:phosphoglycerate dehydrogenase-like enzyme
VPGVLTRALYKDFCGCNLRCDCESARQCSQYSVTAGAIRGAGLDVFYTEPLPSGSPLYKLDNVLMSAHCADRTKEFQHESLQFFVHNVRRFCSGEPLDNVVDKAAGY